MPNRQFLQACANIDQVLDATPEKYSLNYHKEKTNTDISILLSLYVGAAKEDAWTNYIQTLNL